MALTTKKPTINDVARVAGVSKKTVSRVINKSELVSRDTYDRVEKVIAELNFSPDPQARGLSFRRSFLFGLVYDNVNAAFIADIQQGVLDKSRREGYELVVHPCDSEGPQLVDEIVEFVDRLKLAGVIVLPPLSESAEFKNIFRNVSCHYVRILSASLDDPAHIVQSNDRQVVQQVADHLLDLGHREIGFIHGPKNSTAARERFLGFTEALARRNIKLLKRNVAWGDHRFASGIVGAQKLLANKPRPTAIFAGNDEMALGAMVAATRWGIQIPGQLSIVGFDDEPHAAEIYPSLTTVNHNLRHMGQLAAQKLSALCQNDPEQAAGIQTLVELSLIIRETTARVPLDT